MRQIERQRRIQAEQVRNLQQDPAQATVAVVTAVEDHPPVFLSSEKQTIEKDFALDETSSEELTAPPVEEVKKNNGKFKKKS